MSLGKNQPVAEMRGIGQGGGRMPVGEPLFAAYKMDSIPDDCDVMTKLRAKFAQYEEEDQKTGYVRSFLYCQGGQAEDGGRQPRQLADSKNNRRSRDGGKRAGRMAAWRRQGIFLLFRKRVS